MDKRSSGAGGRALASRVLRRVIAFGQTLDDALAEERIGESVDAALIKELCYGSLRWYPRLSAVLDYLLKAPLKSAHDDIRCLLLVGIYQLYYTRIPAHAAVHETVSACAPLKEKWAAGLVNGVLRNAIRNKALIEEQIDSDVYRFAHPGWMIDLIRSVWSAEWQQVLQAMNKRPPLSLRVNQKIMSSSKYLRQLQNAGIAASAIPHTATGIMLEQATAVSEIPGFAEGRVSVQDGAAQLAAPLLELDGANSVLDACAAPGGKTCHILETQPQLHRLTAVDRDPLRLRRVRDNLTRLGLEADLVAADAALTGQWWDGHEYDRILLDAPCTGSGVIRRHPDIKLLRRPDDIASFVEQQRRLLAALWPLLKSNGILLYVTCSIFPAENFGQMEHFLALHRDAREFPIEGSWGRCCTIGRQILPGEDEMDGFYYARLRKL